MSYICSNNQDKTLHKMTIQHIIKQTETLNKEDFLSYLHKLQQIANEKFNMNIFLQNLAKQTEIITEDPSGQKEKPLENFMKSRGILENIDTSDISEEELYLQED